ncbi:MAG: 3-dehydroquinate synthase, partial [Candidatus Cryptobacteroides sp.]
AQIKADIVAQDPDEHGIRKVLNLGHTFAHAIEKLSAGTWSHGNAVAVGIVLAAELSEKVTQTEPGLAEGIRRDFIATGLPTECPWSLSEMADAMAKDKKAGDGKVSFVLLKRPGEVEILPLEVARVCGM